MFWGFFSNLEKGELDNFLALTRSLAGGQGECYRKNSMDLEKLVSVLSQRQTCGCMSMQAGFVTVLSCRKMLMSTKASRNNLQRFCMFWVCKCMKHTSIYWTFAVFSSALTLYVMLKYLLHCVIIERDSARAGWLAR